MTLGPDVTSPGTSGFSALRSFARLETSAVWARDTYLSRSQVTSLCIHGGLALLLVMPLYFGVVPLPHRQGPRITIFDPQPISEYAPKLRPVADPSHGGGGGGDHEQTPATKGMLPTFSMKQPIVPPGLVRNPNAELEVTPTLLGSPQLNVPTPAMENWGLPNAAAFTNSQGPGSDGGFGKGLHGGMGDDGGPGYLAGSNGGTGGNVFTPGPRTGVGFPVCIACPRPDYSEEARKAKVQGSVLLSVIVLPDGKVGGIELLKILGMGLDQQAIDSVRMWKFRPGTDARGKAVATRIPIEVLFQLF
ncbi:MAG TPA: energy transducer TonB [Candidatus Acidoferrales bacterium]|nr:energy transducer TonB [Candidatus Acidoferrales bacterium]